MIIKTLLITAPLFFLAANASYASNCTDLKTCAKLMNDLLGENYIWSSEGEKKVFTATSIAFTKENAAMIFTGMLDQVQLARVPVGDGKTYRIVPSALRKEMEMPIVVASAETRPTVPDTWDWIEMRYKTKTNEITELIESMYRLHVPREARLQADYNGSFLIVDGPAPLIRRMYEVFKAADVIPSAAVREHIKEQRKKWEAKQNKSQTTSMKQ